MKLSLLFILLTSLISSSWAQSNEDIITRGGARMVLDEFVEGLPSPNPPAGWMPFTMWVNAYRGRERGVVILQNIPADKAYRMKGSDSTFDCSYLVDDGTFETNFFEFLRTWRVSNEPILRKGSVYYLEKKVATYHYNSFRAGNNIASFYLTFKNSNEYPEEFIIGCRALSTWAFPTKLRPKLLNLPMAELEQGFVFEGERNFEFLE